MTSDATRSLAETPEHLGRYRLLQQLGQGGMGTVYLALDTKLDRRVAIKVLPAQSVNDAGAVARFQREAKALAKLSHPGIVQAHDADSVEGRHFLVMEHVEGTSLADLLKEKGRPPPAQAADYIHQAALALQHAHEKGLIHRDLKPSNLLLTPQGQVKILDLGLARFLQDQIGDPNVTREGAGLGTPDYAAPEQFRDAHSADVRSDIYALGCTLYHLLAGQVPFPGSSLAEKCLAHEVKEPAALEKLCPESPGGLVLAVARMMAKDPADRFQSALEVANALAPFAAAGSAASFQSLKNTSTWHAGQLTLTALPRRRVKVARLVAGAGGLVLLLALGVWLGVHFFAPAQEASDSGVRAQLPEKEKDARIGDGKKEFAAQAKGGEPSKLAPFAKDPDVLTVSQDPKEGGEFRTIHEALAAVNKPGKIIRVLDAASYPETLIINDAAVHAGVTLEAARRATIAIPAKTNTGVLVRNVPRVTVRGFRIQAQTDTAFALLVADAAAGAKLEDLEFSIARGPSRDARPQAISLEHLSADDAPVMLRHCHILPGFGTGIYVSGWASSYQSPHACLGVVVEDNRINGASNGILGVGALERLHIVGNQVWNADVGIQLENLLPGTKNVLVANNTLFQCANHGFRLWDDDVKGKNIQIRNNLLLGGGRADMIFADSGGDRANARGPGDGKLVTSRWRWDHNGREVKPPQGDDFAAKAWIPPAKEDVRDDEIKVMSRNPAEADFLQPASGSPLATQGAGRTDPSLPSYAGALPPPGTEPWDWTRTWQAPPPGVLLTVSQKPEDKGMYRTINDALAAAKPWATIRVLDDQTYDETLVLDDDGRHRGISLEAPRGAKLLLTPPRKSAVIVKNVSQVRVSGFRMRDAGAPKGGGSNFVAAHLADGLLLHNLDLRGNQHVDGVVVQTGDAPTHNPVVIRRCAIDNAWDGILVSGMRLNPSALPSGKVLIQSNRISNGAGVGVIIKRGIAKADITGNVIWKHDQGILFENTLFDKQRVVVANNTVFDCQVALRFWMDGEDMKPGPGYAYNNLMFQITDADIHYSVSPRDKEHVTGDSQALMRRWRFFNNGRYHLLVRSPEWALPEAEGDTVLKKLDVVSRQPASPDFMRPLKNSPLATKGAGPALGVPSYLGAIPPEGSDSLQRPP